MKSILCLSWLLMQLPLVTQIELVINNQQLQIVSENNTEGYLYRDEKLYQEIKKESYIDGRLIIESIEPGIYTLYDKAGQCVDQEVYFDNHTHIAFDNMVRSQKDNHFLFQTKPKMKIVSPQLDDDYEYTEMNGYYLYEFDEEIIEFFDERYFIYVDQTVPHITMEEMKEIEPQLYMTNQPTLTLHYQDTYPEKFRYLNENELSIQLYEGINDISCYFMDQAQNKMYEKVYVILDHQAPLINEEKELNINAPKMVTIEDLYLDLENSYVKKDNQKIIKLESNEFVFEESGEYEFQLVDLAGNKQNYCFNVHYDKTMPDVIMQINHSELILGYTEALASANLTLMNGDDVIEISNQHAKLEKEGFYYLEGVLVDLAGNRNVIQQEIRVDHQKPSIDLSMDQDVYLEWPKVDLIIKDLFDINWRVELFQKDELIKSIEGVDNMNDNNLFSTLELKNLNGEFIIKIFATDGIHDSELVKSFIIDNRCEPIELKINGCLANQVQDILVNNDVIIEAVCSEGEVYYQLFKDNKVVLENQLERLIITSDDEYSKIELMASDQYGHKTSKILYFNYPFINNTFSFNLFDDSIKKDDVSEEKKEIKNDKVEKVESVTHLTEVKGNDYFLLYLIFGGVCSVFIIIRIFIYAKNRFRKNKNPLSGEKTLLLEDCKDTKCISD